MKKKFIYRIYFSSGLETKLSTAALPLPPLPPLPPLLPVDLVGVAGGDHFHVDVAALPNNLFIPSLEVEIENHWAP